MVFEAAAKRRFPPRKSGVVDSSKPDRFRHAITCAPGLNGTSSSRENGHRSTARWVWIIVVAPLYPQSPCRTW